MREIQTQDVFKLARIIKTANIKDDMAEALRQSTGENEGSVDGVQVLMVLMNACGDEKVESMFYDLLGDIADKKPESIKTMKIKDLSSLLKDIAKENDLENFFGTAVKLA